MLQKKYSQLVQKTHHPAATTQTEYSHVKSKLLEALNSQLFDVDLLLNLKQNIWLVKVQKVDKR